MRNAGGFARRAFLQGVGGATLSLPFLSSLAGGTARAQEKRPTRVVIVFYSHGTIKNRWKPAATGNLSAALPALLAPFEAYKSKLNVLSGIDNIVNGMNRNTNGHNGAARTLLTCQPFQGVKQGQQPDNAPADGPSIDWVLGPKLQSGMPRAVINLGITDSGLGENTIFWRAAGQAATLLRDPKAAADSLFSGISASAPAPAPSPTPSAPAPAAPAPKTPEQLFRGRRRDMVGAVNESYKRLHKRVPAEDRVRLDAHMEQMRELEAIAAAAAGGSSGTGGSGSSGGGGSTPVVVTPAQSCSKPSLSLPSGYSADSFEQENISAAAQIENTVMALACNLAPVVTLQFIEYQNPNFQFLFNGDRQAVLRGSRTYNDWHALVHEAGDANDSSGVNNLARGFTFYMQQIANLWKRLGEVEDGPGQTLQQNTIVLGISEFGDGAHHYTRELPVVLLGDLGGKVRTGQHLDMTGYTTGDLYTTLQAITTGDTAKFGMTGNLSGAAEDNGRAFHRGLLPGLTA
jgi:hypothetical protein